MKKVLLTLFALVCSVTIFAASVGDEFTVDGVKYQVTSVKSGQEKVCVPAQEWTSATLVIPDSVTYDAIKFAVDYIDSNAFQSNTTITSIDVAAQQIYNWAFRYCYNLSSVTLREGVKSIGRETFSHISATSITLPASLNDIGGETYTAFDHNSLEKFVVTEGNTKFIVGEDGALYNTDKTHLYAFPFNYSQKFKEILPSVITIREAVFDNCTNIADTIVLPSTLQRAAAFHGCADIKCVILESNSSYLTNAFQNAGGIEEIIIGKGVKHLGSLMFYRCSAVRKITILSETMPVWNYGTNASWPAFGDCGDSFADCKVYVHCGQSATYAADANKWANFTNIIDTLLYDVDVDVTNATYTVEPTSECNQVKVTVTPETGYAFVNWDNGETANPLTITVTSDTTIRANIKKNLAVGDLFRANTTEGVSVLYKVLTKEPGNMTVQVGELNGFHGANYGQAIDKSYNGPLTISETVNYFDETYTVVALGSGAFSLCKITSLSLPNTVQKFDQNSIYECTKLKSVNIPEGITTIPRYNLSYMSALESITLPNSLEYICSGVFNSNTKLATIVNWNPSQYKRVGNNIGAMNTKFFSDIAVGEDKLVYTGDILLRQNVSANLDTLVIKEGTRIICGDLRGDETLTTIVLPASLEAIGDMSFNAMPNLTSCIIKAAEPVEVYWGRDTDDPTMTKTAANLKFSSSSTPEISTIKFYVPKASVSAYKESATWAGMDIRPIGGWTVTFKDHEGNVIGDPQQVEQGEMPVPPAVETYYTVEHMYTFKQWNATVVAATEDVVYTAEYNEEELPNFYVCFYATEDDALAKTNRVSRVQKKYGENAEANGVTAAGKLTPRECEMVVAWNGGDLTNVTSELHVWPTWGTGEFTITFYNPESSVAIKTISNVECGDEIEEPSDSEIAASLPAGKKFSQWDSDAWKNTDHLSGDIIINAVYVDDSGTGLNNLSNGENAVKVLIDGHLFIRRGNKVYSADGQELK